MTLRDLKPGLRIQVSFPAPGVIGKHFIDAIVFERSRTAAHVALVGHPVWKKHYIGLVLNKRDLDAGLARPFPGVQIACCPSCGAPAHPIETNDDDLCPLCMRDRGLYPVTESP